MLSVTKTMACELIILINLVVNNYLMTRDYVRHQDQVKPDPGNLFFIQKLKNRYPMMKMN